MECLPPARADPAEVNITGLIASFTIQAHLLPTAHFCFVFGRIPLVSRVGKLGPYLTSPQKGLPFSCPYLGSEQLEGAAGCGACPLQGVDFLAESHRGFYMSTPGGRGVPGGQAWYQGQRTFLIA